MNAILNKNSTDVKGCTIYVALFPCNECAKLIIQVQIQSGRRSVSGMESEALTQHGDTVAHRVQSGISRVVYYSDKYSADWKFAASRRLLDMAKVCSRPLVRRRVFGC